MMYNNGFPVTYPQTFYTPPPQPTRQNVGITWVSGEAGAKAYLLAPNTTIALWDSETQVIYLKSADASGMPTIKTLDYTVRDQHTSAFQTPISSDDKSIEYATKADLDKVYKAYSDLKNDFENAMAKKPATFRKKETVSDE